MRVPEMFSDHRMFMFLYALMEMAASVSNVIRIAQITYAYVPFPCKFEMAAKADFLGKGGQSRVFTLTFERKSEFLYFLLNY